LRHPALVAGGLVACFQQAAPRCVVELGAGDGSFLLRTASRLSRRWSAVHAVLVDRRPAVNDALRRHFERLGWTMEVVAADVFDWLQDNEMEAAVANLFLHHFDDSALERLFAMLSTKANALVACEPRRALAPLWLSHLLGLTGCNAVTRHDAPISVRAGFRGAELTARWPNSKWRLQEREAGLFSHLLVARQIK
jgi:hypothetical protein